MRIAIMIVGSLLTASMLLEAAHRDWKLETQESSRSWADLVMLLGLLTLLASIVALARPRIAATMFAGVDAGSAWLVWDLDTLVVSAEVYAWPVVGLVLTILSLIARPPVPIARNGLVTNEKPSR